MAQREAGIRGTLSQCTIKGFQRRLPGRSRSADCQHIHRQRSQPVHCKTTQESWLNIAEIEPNPLCGNPSISAYQAVGQELGAWLRRREQRRIEITQKFGIEDARLKLTSLHPTPEVLARTRIASAATLAAGLRRVL